MSRRSVCRITAGTGCGLVLALAAVVPVVAVEPELDKLAVQATGDNAESAQAAVAALRDAGPEGLDALFEANADALEAWRSANVTSCAPASPELRRLFAALDAVGRVRDCWASRLYWYTDFEEAQQAAKASGRPILSLRLLGNLDDEYSCANSRFFRTALYANEEVSRYLRDNFVLHWKSVRPVPRITIDFGDGRRLERTITGNSIHYVLLPDGMIVDALPGLYGPQAFLAGLEGARETAVACIAAEQPRDVWSILRQRYYASLEGIGQAWSDDLAAVGGAATATPPSVGVRPAALPTAFEAAPIAVTKSVVEIPALRAMRLGRTLEASTTDELWDAIADRHRERARLDEASTRLMRVKCGEISESTDGAADAAFAAKVVRFERAMALDTVRNEYVQRRKVLERLARGSGGDVDRLNAWVYAELFLTPDRDPWLGLLEPDVYAALEDEGVVWPSQAPDDPDSAGTP